MPSRPVTYCGFGSNGEGYHTTLIVRGYHGAGQLVIAGLQIDNQYVSGTNR
ncbi:MAG TPA: hypothetical protein VF912_07760 [Anaeromyxobacter sp.]